MFPRERREKARVAERQKRKRGENKRREEKRKGEEVRERERGGDEKWKGGDEFLRGAAGITFLDRLLNFSDRGETGVYEGSDRN